MDGKQVSLRLRQLVGIEIEGFADAVQKAAGDFFSAIHVAPRTVISGLGVKACNRDITPIDYAVGGHSQCTAIG